MAPFLKIAVAAFLHSSRNLEFDYTIYSPEIIKIVLVSRKSRVSSNQIGILEKGCTWCPAGSCPKIKEEVWVTIKVVAEVDSAVGTTVDARENSTKRSVPTAKKNAKFLSSRPATVRFIARTAFPNARTADADLSILPRALQN